MQRHLEQQQHSADPSEHEMTTGNNNNNSNSNSDSDNFNIINDVICYVVIGINIPQRC